VTTSSALIMKTISPLASKQQALTTESHCHNGRVSSTSCSTELNKALCTNDWIKWSYTIQSLLL